MNPPMNNFPTYKPVVETFFKQKAEQIPPLTLNNDALVDDKVKKMDSSSATDEPEAEQP